MPDADVLTVDSIDRQSCERLAIFMVVCLLVLASKSCFYFITVDFRSVRPLPRSMLLMSNRIHHKSDYYESFSNYDLRSGYMKPVCSVSWEEVLFTALAETRWTWATPTGRVSVHSKMFHLTNLVSLVIVCLRYVLTYVCFCFR